MKIYGFTVTNSEAFTNGKESMTFLFLSEKERNKTAYKNYRTTVKVHNNDIGDIDEDEIIVNNQSKFDEDCNKYGYEVLQLDSFHMQWEYFEQEV